MMSNFFSVLKNFSFEGRASRREYWTYMLVLIPVMIAALLSAQVLGEKLGAVVYFVFAIGTLVQNFALGVRRLHDTDRSGWYCLVSIIPVAGGLIYLFFVASAGTPGPNNYGHDPNNPNPSNKVEGAGGWKKVG